MPVLPEQITTTVFRRHWRGYDPGQVDGFLRGVQTDYTGAIERIAAMSDQRDRARTELDHLRQRTDTIVEAARHEAAQLRREAESDTQDLRTRAEQTAALIVSQAEERQRPCGTPRRCTGTRSVTPTPPGSGWTRPISVRGGSRTPPATAATRCAPRPTNACDTSKSPSVVSPNGSARSKTP